MNKQTVKTAGTFWLPKIRHLVQLAALGILGKWAFYGIFRCPFLVPFVNCRNCPIVTCWGRLTAYFFGAWLLIPLLTIIAGRAFCSWLCPVGSVNQLLGKLAILKLRIYDKRLRFAQAGMLLLFFIAMYIVIDLGNPRMMVPIRVGEFILAVKQSFALAPWVWLVRSCFIIILILASLLIANLWCRFFCPAGGIMEVVKRISLFGIRKTNACNGCNACTKICSMGTRPEEMNCTNCGDCLHTCPQHAIYWGRKKHDQS